MAFRGVDQIEREKGRERERERGRGRGRISRNWRASPLYLAEQHENVLNRNEP